MELTPINGFFLVILLISLILWALGLCGSISQAMHAQAMEYNEVYTGLTDEEEEEEKDRRAKAKLDTFLSREQKDKDKVPPKKNT
jgi:uncharacterized protein YceK